MLDGGDALAVGDGDVRPRLDEQPNDLRVLQAAVAEDHRLEERRPAEIVDVVDVDLGLEQPSHDLDVAAVRSGDQRRSAEAVRPGQVGLRSEYLFEDVDESRLAGRQQRVGARRVLEVDVGAGTPIWFHK